MCLHAPRSSNAVWRSTLTSLALVAACNVDAYDDGDSSGGCDGEEACLESSGIDESSWGSAASPHDDAPSEPFTDHELNLIRMHLGVVPEAPPPDPSNAFADDLEVAQLGQMFYFDPRYSRNETISCATCHDPIVGFQDVRANTSPGLDGRATGRHAPTVINSAYGIGDDGVTNWQFWDGRKDSQWSQALGPPENPVEMGGSRTGVAYLIAEHYRDRYEAIFGPLPQLHTEDGEEQYDRNARPGHPAWETMSERARHDINAVYVNFGKSIAAYERRIVSRSSRFDAFYLDIARGARDSDHLSDLEKVGLSAFIGRARCLDCHKGPLFSDWKFYNIAVAQEGDNLPEIDNGRQDGLRGVMSDEFNCVSEWSDHPDKASCGVANLSVFGPNLGSFKTPGLRDISKTAPYMHTGTLSTLEDVIEHYDRGGHTRGYVGRPHDALVEPLDLDAEEKSGLVAFLRALDGESLPSELLNSPELP